MKLWGKNVRSLRNSNEMVSDLVGTMVLLAISVVIFSSLYGMVLSYPFASDPATVTIIGTIDGNNIILEHRGGEALGLETTIPITIAGEKLLIDGRIPTVLDLLIDSNGDGLWNIGERLVCNFTYDPAKLEADVMAIDVESNSLVLTGTLDIHPESDVGIKVVVDDQFPFVGNTTTLTITAANYRGDMGATGVEIQCVLPENLVYVGNSSSRGTYDHIAGIWYIDNLAVGESATINITANVSAIGETDPAQLAMVLDGSGSISGDDWDIMLEGLATAIEDVGCFPHDGSVELTVIQFGGNSNSSVNARLELGGPKVITDDVGDPGYYKTVAEDVRNIDKYFNEWWNKSYTPTACGIARAADTLKVSENFDTHRHVISLVTDGQPNAVYNIENGDYKIEPGSEGTSPEHFQNGKASAVIARDYLISALSMTEDQDELDAVAVGSNLDIPWLRDSIVWPQPGYDIWPSPDSGWVHTVSNYTEFAQTIDEQFELIFNRITSTIEIVASTPIDPNGANNKVSVILVPQES